MSANELKDPLLAGTGRISAVSIVKNRMDLIMNQYRGFDPFENYEFQGHTGQCWACTMTSDNSVIFSGADDNLIKLWDGSTKSFMYDLVGHTDCVYSLDITNDDKHLISASWDFRILIWDWRNKTIESTLGSHTNQIFGLVITSDGKQVVTGGRDSMMRVWDLETKTSLGEAHCGGDSVFGVAVTHDKTEIITCDGQQNIRFFNFNTKQLISCNATNNGVPQCVAVTTDKKYVIIGTRTFFVIVWNYTDKTVYHSFKTHLHWVRSLALTSDNNYIFSGSADKTIRVYNIASKTEEFKIEGGGGFINYIYLSKDGKYLLSAATDKSIKLWNVGVPLRVRTLRGHTNTIICLAITSDDKYIVTGSEDKTIRIWSIDDFAEVAKLEGHSETIWGIAVTQDMKTIVSASADKTVGIWDFETHTNRAFLNASGGVLYAIHVSSDGKYVAAGGNDMKITLWNLQTHEQLKILEGHTDTIFTLKFLNNNTNFVTGAADYTVMVWDAVSLKRIDKFEPKTGMIESIAFNKDETFMVIGDRNNLVHLWDWPNKKLIKTFKNHTNWVKSVHFAPDGNTFLSAGSDFNIHVWNANEERHEYLLKGHTNFVRTAAFTMDGRYIVSAGNDQTIKLWNIERVEPSELSDIGSTVDSFLFLAKIRKKYSTEQINLNAIFGPLQLNIVHFYAYLGYDDLLEKALELGAEIRIDNDRHSPLHYALERRCQSCIDVILKFLVNLKSKNFDLFINYTYALRDDFEKLLENSSENLPDFLDAIFFKVSDVTSFAVPKVPLPALNFSLSKTIDPLNFVFSPEEIPQGLIELPIEFKTLPFSISYLPGSSGSIDILDSISACPNKLILETEFVKDYIRNKWDNLWNYILILTILMWVNLALMASLIVLNYQGFSQEWYYTAAAIAFLLVNVLLTGYEFVQAYSQGLKYFLDIWNLIDVTRIGLCIVWTIFSFNYIDDIRSSDNVNPNNEFFRILTWFMAIANFLRGLSGFRAFDSTRYYTRLIIRGFFDSLAFLLVFFYSTLAFGVIYYSANIGKTVELEYFWRWPYELSMGNFDNDTDDLLVYICFMIGTIINVIIILNLLISILGDSFDSFQAESLQIDCLDMAELVTELETLMVWNREKREKLYIQKCTNYVGEGAGKWEGKLKAIYNMIQDTKSTLSEQNNKILNKLDELLAKK